MPEITQPKWPILLFVATAISGIISTAATVTYYSYTGKVYSQQQEIAEKRQLYQAEVDDLRKKLIIEKAVVQTIPTPVLTMKKNCISMPFGGQACVDVPETRVELKEVSVTTQVQDPAVKAQLDLKLKEIETLSAAAVKTQGTQVDLKSLVDTSRQLIAPIISLLVSIASLFIILSKKYQAESEKWAFGSLGTILGFWLK